MDAKKIRVRPSGIVVWMDDAKVDGMCKEVFASVSGRRRAPDSLLVMSCQQLH